MSNQTVKYVCGECATDMTQAVISACREPSILVSTNLAAVEAGTLRIRLQCKDGHWCDFPCTPVPGPTVEGTPVPPKEVERWTAWQAYADPIEGMKRLDTYANWVLAAGAIVILLASGLASNSTPPKLETLTGKWLFGSAVAALGLSWVFISFVKAPTWSKLNRHSPPDYLLAFNKALRWRRVLFSLAASLLGLSLALAALIPLGESLRAPVQPRVVFTYSWSADSAFRAEVRGEGLPPHSPIEVLIHKDAPVPGILPMQRARADAKGVGTASVEVAANRRLEPPFRIFWKWQKMGSDSMQVDSASFPPRKGGNPADSAPPRSGSG